MRCVPDAVDGLPAHVTVAYPFAEPGSIDDAVVGLVAEVVARRAPWTMRLVERRRWPDTVYASVEPEAPAIALQADLAAAFPSLPIYGGAIEVFVPHVTIAEGPSADDPAVDADPGLGRPAGDVRRQRGRADRPVTRWALGRRAPVPDAGLTVRRRRSAPGLEARVRPGAPARGRGGRPPRRRAATGSRPRSRPRPRPPRRSWPPGGPRSPPRRPCGRPRRRRRRAGVDRVRALRAGSAARSSIVAHSVSSQANPCGGGVAPRSSASKHERVPRWHVGPAGSTPSSSASPSQSTASDRSRRTLPDVSPLRHSVPRDREWKCTSPVARVAASASASSQPTISTRPSATSWTTPATSPSAPQSTTGRSRPASSTTGPGVAVTPRPRRGSPAPAARPRPSPPSPRRSRPRAGGRSTPRARRPRRPRGPRPCSRPRPRRRPTR